MNLPCRQSNRERTEAVRRGRDRRRHSEDESKFTALPNHSCYRQGGQGSSSALASGELTNIAQNINQGRREGNGGGLGGWWRRCKLKGRDGRKEIGKKS